MAATPTEKNWRPNGRQLGRQLSPRDVWTYDDKIELAANWLNQYAPKWRVT